jgi:hypothetical protein
VALDILVSAIREQFFTAFLDLVFGDEHVDSAFVEIDAEHIAVAEDGEIAVLCGFGTCVEDAGGA